jgi:hypothetical protein
MITRHSGMRLSVRMPFRLRNILRYSRDNADWAFFEYVAICSPPRIFSTSSSRPSRLRIVRKFVKQPPSQRSATNGM